MNAPLTEQQHASGFALSHAVVERPFPSKLGSISKENNGLSVSTKPGTVEESGEIDGVLVNTNQRKLLKLPMKPLTDGQTISSQCVSGAQTISPRPKNSLKTEAIKVAHEAANRWTDNIFTMRQWFSKNFPQAKEQLEHLYNGCNEIFVYGVAHLHSGGVGTALYGERKTLTTMTFAELILDESARAKLKEKALDSDTNGQGKNSQDHEDPDDPYVRLKHDCVAIMAAFKIKEPYEHYGIVVNSHNYWDPKWADAKLAQAKYCASQGFNKWQPGQLISARSRRDLVEISDLGPENEYRDQISDQNLGTIFSAIISEEKLAKMSYYELREIDGLNHVLQNGPWMVSNKPCMVQKWDPSVIIDRREPENLNMGGDENHSDTEEEVKEEEAIDKQEVALPCDLVVLLTSVIVGTSLS
ncbi:DNAse I-like superfamily protein [Tanacetum coccineum]